MLHDPNTCTFLADRDGGELVYIIAVLILAAGGAIFDKIKRAFAEAQDKSKTRSFPTSPSNEADRDQELEELDLPRRSVSIPLPRPKIPPLGQDQPARPPIVPPVRPPRPRPPVRPGTEARGQGAGQTGERATRTGQGAQIGRRPSPVSREPEVGTAQPQVSPRKPRESLAPAQSAVEDGVRVVQTVIEVNQKAREVETVKKLAPQAPQSGLSASFRRLDSEALRRAIILNEILGPPVALRDQDSR